MFKQTAFLLIFLISCSNSSTVRKGDITIIQNISEEIFSSSPDSPNDYRKKHLQTLPHLKIKDVRIESNGIYLVLDSFFVSESGIFILNTRQSTGKPLDNHSDPSYTLITGNVYWYKIKG